MDVRLIALQLSKEAREIHYGSSVRRIPMPNNTVDFMRLICANRPVILENAVKEWPAFRKWTNAYLGETLSETICTVSCTPDGLADAVKQIQLEGKNVEGFTLPYEARMSFPVLLHLFETEFRAPSQKTDRVHYLQLQNDSLRLEFPQLLDDIPSELTCVSEALQKGPEAINLWIGENRSVSSLHKDHYENFYAVIRGRKRFTLFPPTDSYFFTRQPFPTYRYQEDMNLERVNGHDTTWYRQPKADELITNEPLIVDVNAGEMLFLPALWYHKVEQECDQDGLCIAVNYWYDMDYDFRYVWQQSWSRLGEN